MDSPSSSSESPSSPSSVPTAMQGGGTLGRTLGVGWQLALRLWAVAAVAAAPALAASLLGNEPAPASLSWRGYAAYGLDALVHALIAASLLPSVMRWFADAREVTTFHGRDLRGRLGPALAASVAGASIAVLMGVAFPRQSVLHKEPASAWPTVALLAGCFVVLWVKLRLMLMVAVAVVERCSLLVAVRRSWSLTRGWMPTILGVGFVLAVGWLVPVVVSMMAGHAGQSSGHHLAWSAAVSQTLMMPWFFAFVAVLYHDARIRHDDTNTRRIAEDATSR